MGDALEADRAVDVHILWTVLIASAMTSQKLME
jgi:hypothetical protein